MYFSWMPGLAFPVERRAGGVLEPAGGQDCPVDRVSMVNVQACAASRGEQGYHIWTDTGVNAR